MGREIDGPATSAGNHVGDGPRRRVPPMAPQTPAAWPFGGLRFPDTEEEAAFSEAYQQSRFVPADGWRQRLVLIITTTFALGRLSEDYRDGGLTLRGLSAAGAGAMYWLVNWLWGAWGVDSRPRLRTGMVVLTRVLAVLPIALFAHIWFNQAVTTWRGLFGFLVMNSGVVGLSFHSFAQPLLTWHHLVLQVPTVAFMVLYMPRLVCTESSITAESAAYFVAAWKWFSLGATGVWSGMPLPPAQDCCKTIMAMTQIMGGLLVPSYILWALEYWARFQFSPRSLDYRQLTREAIGVHVWLLFMVMSCVWTLWHIGQWS